VTDYGYLKQLTIKVPGPFAGVADLGFSARYPEQTLFEPLRDVPLWIEGPARPMRSLVVRLARLAEALRGAYAWTQPVALTDEVVVIAFRDRSGRLSLGPGEAVDYLANLVRPVVFPFLQDCAVIANLRLTDEIEMALHQADRQVAVLTLARDRIVPSNGNELLSA
jgi:hypothetical protein